MEGKAEGRDGRRREGCSWVRDCEVQVKEERKQKGQMGDEQRLRDFSGDSHARDVAMEKKEKYITSYVCTHKISLSCHTCSTASGPMRGRETE